METPNKVNIILSRDKMNKLRSFWDNAYSAGCEDQLHNRVGKDCDKKFKEDVKLCAVLPSTISRDKMIEVISKTLYPLKLKDDVLNSLADAILKSGLPEKKDIEKKVTFKEAMDELRPLMAPYWDNVKCVCNELGRNKCSQNCPEYEDEYPAIS